MMFLILNQKYLQMQWTRLLSVAKEFFQVIDMLRPYLQKKHTCLRIPVSVKAHVCSFLYYVNGEGRSGKAVNAFGISRASISRIIRRVACAVTTFLGNKLIRFTTTEGEVQELNDGYLETHGSPQCMGKIMIFQQESLFFHSLFRRCVVTSTVSKM